MHIGKGLKTLSVETQLIGPYLVGNLNEKDKDD